MKIIEFQIEGMTCGGCAGGISGKLKETSGIDSVDVSHETKLVKIRFDENIISKNDIFQIIKEMNYIPSDI